MGYSAVALGTNQSVDAVSPSAPTIVSITQTNNTNWDFVATLPTTDDPGPGTPLSGMTRLTVASLAMADGVNPFEGLSMDQILAMNSPDVRHVSVTPEMAGLNVTVNVPVLNLGGFQAFACAVTDATV